MTVPSQMSLRRIPDALHLQVRVGYAASWEAIIDTHTRQALQFVTEFAPRISVLEGLDLYFRVTAVPESMHEVVRSRTLTALDLKTIPPPMELPALTGWGRLRLDLLLEHRRYRRRYNERTLELAQMAGARAAEATVATHVENALELAWLLKGVMPVNATADHYLREFGSGERGADGHAARTGTGGGRRAHRSGGRAPASRARRRPPRARRRRSPNRRRMGCELASGAPSSRAERGTCSNLPEGRTSPGPATRSLASLGMTAPHPSQTEALPLRRTRIRPPD